jgi:dihydroorotate dehydrogenase electron transfer subunit
MPIDVAARVIANRPLSSEYNILALAAPAIAAAAAPGQFVMLKPGTGTDPLLRRPFSVFEVLRDESGAATGLTILSKRIGPSTSLIYAARDGDHVDCLGPLGRPFTIVNPRFEAWMIAGGVGLAPFATLAQSLRARGVATTLFYGARRAEELFHLDFFRNLDVELVLTTEDGSLGERGRVVAPLDRRLTARPSSALVMLYACGPEGMLAATARTATKHGRPCEVSVERIMGCGLGGCYSCVVPMRGEDGIFHHVRSCLTGPVLNADKIRWTEELSSLKSQVSGEG